MSRHAMGAAGRILCKERKWRLQRQNNLPGSQDSETRNAKQVITEKLFKKKLKHAKYAEETFVCIANQVLLHRIKVFTITNVKYTFSYSLQHCN
jgi:hypothetical protein